MPVLTAQERIGTRVAGKYEITEILGEGGMGVVFGGKHVWTGREVAIKILRVEYSESPRTVRRFLQEARAAAAVEHPHVVDVLDMGRDQDNTVYMVLEKLEGEPLRDRLDRGILPARDAVKLLVPVMEGLAAAHDAGIIHRDLKPDNIFLCESKQGGTVPKLLDFGIAKILDDEKSSHTQTGTIMGTPFYMSPEQILGEGDLAVSTDVWSMAVVFYEAVSGKLPHNAKSPTAAYALITGKPPIPLRKANGALPSELCHYIDTALSMDVTKRPSMRELAASLRALLDEPNLLPTGRFEVVDLSIDRQPEKGADERRRERARLERERLIANGYDPALIPPSLSVPPQAPSGTPLSISDAELRAGREQEGKGRLAIFAAVAVLILVLGGGAAAVIGASGGDPVTPAPPTAATQASNVQAQEQAQEPPEGQAQEGEGEEGAGAEEGEGGGEEPDFEMTFAPDEVDAPDLSPEEREHRRQLRLAHILHLRAERATQQAAGSGGSSASAAGSSGSGASGGSSGGSSAGSSSSGSGGSSGSSGGASNNPFLIDPTRH